MTRLVVPALVLCLPGSGFAQTTANPHVRLPPRPVVRAATCLPTTMTVAPGLAEAPPRSFSTLANALHYAESHNVCGVLVTLGPGTYTGEFLITRGTTVTGQPGVVLAGSVRNPSGFELTLDNLIVSHAPDVGVFQGGGHATLRRVLVAQTHRTSNAISSGTAIEIHTGAIVTLDHVTIEDNDGVGLYLDGRGTTVHASDLIVRKNRIHPAAKDAFARTSAFNRVAAVEVAGEAELYAERFTIVDNEVIGVLARNRGAAHLRYGDIAATTLYSVAGSTVSYGGINVMSRNEARLELSEFTSTRAGACGLDLARGYLKSSGKGEVHDNAIGLCVHEPLPGFDAMVCVTTPTVRFYGNGTNLDAQTLSVPDPACAMPNPPPGCSKSGATCPGVPWK